MKKISLQFFVAGKVQGVWYRASTQQQAQELGITGWAKNLSDGRVEVFACGTEPQLNALREWLWRGPDRAQVTAVTVTANPWQDHEEFVVI